MTFALRTALLAALLAALGAVAAWPATAAADAVVSLRAAPTLTSGKKASIRVGGRTDTMALLRVRFAAPGRTCPATLPDDAAGTFQRVLQPGPIAFSFRHRLTRVGTWRACGYLTTSQELLSSASARIVVRRARR